MKNNCFYLSIFPPVLIINFSSISDNNKKVYTLSKKAIFLPETKKNPFRKRQKGVFKMLRQTGYLAFVRALICFNCNGEIFTGSDLALSSVAT